ncbi:MAG: GGDEF domain-containing protein [Oscillospiraceae bacterium]|nr:GGDEF domain-containing protein [Oscillospiraceae bacterium]
MTAKKRPIQRSIITGCAMFLIILCLMLSAQSYFQYSNALYRQCQLRLSEIIRYVEEHIDEDDLYNCVVIQRTSEKYDELQKLLNGMVDTFDLSYLYICYPYSNAMINVVSATSQAERERGEEDMGLLQVEMGYSNEVLALYQKAWKTGELTFFTSKSDYGTCYTGCSSLKSHNGKTFALLCADVYVDDLRASVHSFFFLNAGITILLVVIFGVLLVSWLRKNVTGPVAELEKSTRKFAEKSHGTEELRRLRFEKPELPAWNEVSSLAEAITKMTEDIKKHVEDVYSAEVRAKSAKIEAEDMSRIAYQDALTHVKNKTAYNAKAKELAGQIEKSAAEFAIVMVDVNFLKKVNDTYGHEFGDKYLIGACEIICDVFKHSPVYRIGGDEFLAILQGHDYEQREELMVQLRERFRGSDDTSLQPWENFSAACGIGVYRQGNTVEEVFQDADGEMYRNKVEMKGGRE